MITMVLLAGSSCQNQSEDTTAEATPMVKKVASGEELYISYCQICHGEKGDGVMTDVLTVAPSDLTTIAARRNGGFPRDDIRDIIDGRKDIKGHGTRDMPIWGATFMKSEDLASEEEVDATITRLIDYLEGIQVEGD